MPASSSGGAIAVIPRERSRLASRRGDPFDTRALVAESAERQYLAGLIDVLYEQPDRARELVSLVDREMFVADGTGEIHAAIRRVLEDVVKPVRADVLSVLRRESAAVGVAWEDDPVRHLFFELVKDPLLNCSQAERLAGEAAAEVAELHRRRRSIELLGDAVLRLHDGESAEGVGELLEQVQAVRSAGAGPSVVTLADAVAAWAADERVPTVQTLFEPFDRATDGGLPIGGITTLVAPPEAGKSAFAWQLSLGALMGDENLRAVYGLGEMDLQSLATRLACVGASLLGDEPVTMKEARARCPQARATLDKLVGSIGGRLSIVKPPLTVERLDEEVRRTGAKLVVIDYLQLVEAEGASRVEVMDAVVGRIRDLAVRRGAAVIMISSIAKAANETVRAGQFCRFTAEADYAAEFLFYAIVEPHEDNADSWGVTWKCGKARNVRKTHLELQFEGAYQTFSAAVVPFAEFQRFGPGGSA